MRAALVAEAENLLADNSFLGSVASYFGVGHYGTASLSAEAQVALERLAETGVERAVELVALLGI